MFLVTQLIGLAVIYSYTPIIQQVEINGTLQNITVNPLPYGLEPPEVEKEISLLSIIFAFIIAVFFVFLLTKLKAALFIRLWFFVVVIIVLAITFNALLIIISVYDIWAVWHSGFMQKMAKYQINELKLFAGFFVPYLNKKQRELVREAKAKKSKLKKSMKVNLAILGGGDVVFPIITAGVIFRTLGLLPALIVSLCATISLFILFVFAKKGKFYPAMPFITAGLLVGIGLAYLVSFI